MVTPMHRTQVQIDDETYERLRRRAYERRVSISSVVREALTTSLGTRPGRRPLRVDEVPFVAAGTSQQGALSPVSERHDEALAEAATARRRR